MPELICRLPEKLLRKEDIDAFPQHLTGAVSDNTDVELRIETFDTSVRAAANVPCGDYDYPPEAEPFLHPSLMIESLDGEIQSLAAKLAAGCADVVSLAQHFCAWIAASIVYDQENACRINDGAEPLSALQCLRSSKGTCGEKAHLLAALLRARSVPARFVHGVLVPTEQSGTVLAHAWVEVYLQSHGWLPVDPRDKSGGGNADYLTGTNYVKLFMGLDFSDIGMRLPDLRGMSIDWSDH